MLRPGWLVALCAAVLAVSTWLPWLTTDAGDGGRASAIGGIVGDVELSAGFGVGQLIVLLASALIVAAAMAARGLSARLASATALTISALLVVLIGVYYQVYVQPPLGVGYGMYIGAVAAAGGLALSVWAVVSAWSPSGRGE